MRILVLSPSVYPQPGGLQRYTYNLAATLAGRGHDVHLLTLDEAEGFRSTSANLTYSAVERWQSVSGGLLAKLSQKAYLAWTLHQTLKRFNPDQIICTWWDPLGYLALPLSRLRGVPLLCVGHGQEVIRLPQRAGARWLKKWLRDLTFRSASRAIAVSCFTKQHILNMPVHEERVKVVPNGLSPDYIEAASSCSQELSRAQLNLDGHTILQVGRLVPRKGHMLVLQALRRVRQMLAEPVRYVIVGSGPYGQELQAAAADSGVAQNVLFTGFIPDDELHHYYSASDVVVMPAFNPADPGDVEGFGIVYLEAYAHRKPVIGAEAGGAPDAIVRGETGLLVPPGDIEALASALLRLLQNPPLAESMGSHGQALVRERWNWELLSDEFLL